MITMVTCITTLKEIKDKKKITITGKLTKFKQIKENNTFLTISNILYTDCNNLNTNSNSKWYPKIYIDYIIREFKSKFNTNLDTGNIVEISGEIIFDYSSLSINNIILNDKYKPKYLNVYLVNISNIIIKRRNKDYDPIVVFEAVDHKCKKVKKVKK